MNGKKATPPCKCGYHGHPNGRCKCAPDQVAFYRSRISGPLLDRIDLQVQVPALTPADFELQRPGECSAAVRERVARTRAVQLARQGMPNAKLSGAEVERLAVPDAKGTAILRNAAAKLHLSGRARHRVLKVARTIADLEGSTPVRSPHLAEALLYRGLP